MKDIVASVCCEGRNGTVFSYGQTSTGKTYTMYGVVCAAGSDIFQVVDSDTDAMTSVNVSCMELYNEEVRDLLTKSDSSPTIQEDKHGNVNISNMTERKVSNLGELMAVLRAGENNRTVGKTSMNERSSRSHTIFRITVEKKTTHGAGDKENNGKTKKVVTTRSTLNLVDLAGSESVRLTNASGTRQKEGGKINQR